ncbi:flagellar motor switch protein FliM [Candidatus Epulonipiscium fishelsonii]|uniref:Flagellar motor switch protein FliM n=1 Tax=Candidatus Epulonipiscium fishelsonii TaxID=77094 RepID=A0ACC8XDM6_9FIRM|nr:flagellar motor switch protein FliM [Epulopiscium sp. SCG-B05WGA-EpuloA1]ONI40991.1 flagellar motor switch protein FliM [Epulopiscium sp. SCG-B11WGA-EpuloA1]
MADGVLTQYEIDAIINAGVSTDGKIDLPEESEKELYDTIYKKYDFKRPSKFSKEQLRTLEIICENYARLVSNYLSGYLRTLIPVEVMSSEAITYSEFTISFSNPVVLGFIDFLPLEGSILLEISPSMSYAFIERILGGAGKSVDKLREFTNIEQIIIQKILDKFTQLLIEPWESVMEIRPILSKIETNSQVVQLIAPNEMVALITFRIQFGELEGLMNLCLPHIVLEPVMDRINTKNWFKSTQSSREKANSAMEVEGLLKKTDVILKAVLGQTNITVKEFLELQVNDIIKLNRDIESDIDIYVDKKLKFKGSPGSYKSRSAIKINQVLQEEDE